MTPKTFKQASLQGVILFIATDTYTHRNMDWVGNYQF